MPKKPAQKEPDYPAILKRIQTASEKEGHTKDKNVQGRLSFKRAFATKIGARDAAANRIKILNSFNTSRKVEPGRMYFFKYDPKYRDTLPVWDAFPLVFVLETYNDGFLALNLHFVPPLVRQRIFVAFLKNAVLNKDTIKMIRLSYSISRSLLQVNQLKPMIKRYLWSQFRSPLKFVPSDIWEDILILPVQQFHVNQPKR